MSDDRRKKSPKLKTGEEPPNDTAHEVFLCAKKRRSPGTSRNLGPPTVNYRLSDDEGDEQVRKSFSTYINP